MQTGIMLGRACTAGWASAWFVLVAVVLELGMNTKLIYIARDTARGGVVHRLKPSIFWFGAKGPWYALPTPLIWPYTST